MIAPIPGMPAPLGGVTIGEFTATLRNDGSCMLLGPGVIKFPNCEIVDVEGGTQWKFQVPITEGTMLGAPQWCTPELLSDIEAASFIATP